MCADDGGLFGIPPRMPRLSIGFAGVSTDQQDLTAQRDAPAGARPGAIGVPADAAAARRTRPNNGA